MSKYSLPSALNCDSNNFSFPSNKLVALEAYLQKFPKDFTPRNAY